ncbi:MAG: response regulator [Planctomycetota bacterium]
MLVVTRRSTDKISFPQLGITVHFIRVQGSSAKVGVDAPRDIVIVRDEVLDDEAGVAKLRDQWLRLPSDVRHEIRNELHAVSVGLHLYKQQLAAGLDDEAGETFDEIQSAISRIDENDVLRRPEAEAEERPRRGLPGTILLVEDDDNEREMLAGILRLKGHAVVSVRDGQEALDYLAGHDTPSVVMVDMKMPRCDGGTMVNALRGDQRHSAARVFAISGSSPEENSLQVGEGGVDRWFRKPLNPQYLLEAI